ncbi:hypothetical protein CIK05_10320 [Bdellovibrio sp. qaytius]|nr:hypothetical protein CIK05_10320 [Bdellovibrio sp. qaytius]
MVYTCEKIISSEIKGRPQDKIASAKYSVWLQESDKALCVDGKNSSGTELGKGATNGDSKLPQSNQAISGMWSQELTVNDDSWRLTQTNDASTAKLYPNNPKNYDHYFMDLKNSELTVANPTGVKSFATFKMSCIKN